MCTNGGIGIIFSLIIASASSAGLLGLNLDGTRYNTDGVVEDTKFYRFYRDQNNGSVVYEDATEDMSNINPELPLTVIAHGFMGSALAKSTRLLIDGYVNKNVTNVIGLDWTQLAQGPWYSSAADGAFEAAHKLADWLEKAVSANRTTWPKIHLIGFSLGAQVVGLTSKYLQDNRVGRITGLDPARPLFDEKTSKDRLDMEDADFVSVVHSCGGFLAFTEPLGHVDFYPNGGVNPQPPCKNVALKQETMNPMMMGNNNGATKVFASLVCSHYIALSLWVESLRPEAKFTATYCSTWQSFLNNKCLPNPNGQSEIVLGEDTPRSARGTYFMKTEEKEFGEGYAPKITELIQEGIEEYSRLFLGDILEQDKGQAEIQEIKPHTSNPQDTSGKSNNQHKDHHQTDQDHLQHLDHNEHKSNDSHKNESRSAGSSVSSISIGKLLLVSAVLLNLFPKLLR